MTEIKLGQKIITPQVMTTPHNHVCMYGHCTNMAKPEKSVRAGSTVYHYCELHP